ncbi:MAG: nucleotidyltransferase family protein [Chloroflexota bacterium]|nr:nucleotidyltransferase family protein [Chloroflexota bacterium]
MHPFTSAILLAAGVSRRMGALKALLDWHGRPLIMHQIVALRAAGADEVVVVLGHRADELQARVGANSDVYAAGNVRCVINTRYAEGKTTSIKTGLRGISTNPEHAGPILMLNVDQPRSVNVIRAVLAAHADSSALITIPTCGGKGGHPIAISRALYPELLEITEATQGMRAVTQRHKNATQRVELNAPELLWDVNTPEQYRAALAESGSADQEVG